ncbi:peptidase M15 [Vibrio phage 1.082.O._10N.261.49.E4]|nr:peptidase M15 [Vibrio phage 1.082.O._10N.261.49.E4]
MNTANIKESEFACRCCGKVKIERELVMLLQMVRTHFNRPLTITSGYRCPSHNANVGGVKNSQHAKGTAADIVVSGIEPSEVYHFIDSLLPNSYGLGLYINKGFVHVDVRAAKARWDG